MFSVMEGLINNNIDISKIKSNLEIEKRQESDPKISLPQRNCLKYHMKFDKNYSEEFVFEAVCNRINIDQLKDNIVENLCENSVVGIEQWLKKNKRYEGGSLRYKGFSIGLSSGEPRGFKIEYATMGEGWKVIFFTWKKVAKEIYIQLNPTGD